MGKAIELIIKVVGVLSDVLKIIKDHIKREENK